MQIDTLPNLRDVGGHSTTDGRTVRTGVVFRSVDLGRLDATGIAQVSELGVRTVYDLRTAAERDARPDRLPSGIEEVTLDVFADAEHQAPAQLQQLLSDPEAARAFAEQGGIETQFTSAYRDLVRLPSARRSYAALFRGLTTAPQRPALFHCTTGKDRTGWAAAALLTFLGVEASIVLDDYLRTNTDLIPALRPLFDRFEAAGGDPRLLDPVLGVRTEYLDTAFSAVDEDYGSIEGYFTDGLGLDERTLEHLREALLTDPDTDAGPGSATSAEA